MKKLFVGVYLCFMIGTMVGCATNKDEKTVDSSKDTSRYDSAMEKGKEAIVDKDLSKAIASFHLALEYDEESKEATTLIQQAELYKEAIRLKEDEHYTEALKKVSDLVESKKGSKALKQYGEDLIKEIDKKIEKQSSNSNKSEPEEKIGFNVIKLKNNSADNHDLGYFELTTKKGTKQKVQLQIENLKDQELTINQTINSAWTSNKGTIEYGKNPSAYDSSLKQNMAAYTELKEGQAFTLAPKETKIITATINVPTNITEGDLLGGWCLEENIQKNGQSNQSNRYASITGFHIIVGQTLKDNSLAIAEAKLADVDYQSGVVVRIENSAARIESFKRFTIEVLSEEGESIVEKTEMSFKMAPNSYSEYGMKLDHSDEIKDGKYLVKMTVELADGQLVEQEKELKP